MNQLHKNMLMLKETKFVGTIVNEMHIIYSKSDWTALHNALSIVYMLDCRGANKEKKILIRTTAVRIATSK